MAKSKFTEKEILESGKHDPVIFSSKAGYKLMSRSEIQAQVAIGVAYYTRGRIKAGKFSLEIYKSRPGITYRWSGVSGSFCDLPGAPKGFVMNASLPGFPRAVRSKDSGWHERLENEERRKKELEKVSK